MALEQKEYKLSIRVTPEFYTRFRGIAEKYGLTLNQLGNMAMQSGIGNIVRALNPEEAYSPDQLAAIIQALSNRGVDVQVPGAKDGA